MTCPRVLNVGQCGYDHGRIARQIEQTFHAQVRDASTFNEAVEALRSERFDLVLVNRVNNLDGAPGLDLIRSLKGTADLADVPVMLISNYPDAQEQAQALGALPGFGKAELGSETTRARLAAVLGPPAPGEQHR